MTLAIAQDRILKVLSESGLAGLMGEGEAASGDGFLNVMDELAGDDGKKGDPAASEGQASEGQKSLLPPLAALDVALASASIANAMQASVQISANAVETQSTAAKAVSDLAQLLVKSANDAQGATIPPSSDAIGADMSEAGVTLEAWSQGPSAAAAMTTGAQDKRPMQMAVVDVATHFAPVEMVSEADVVAGQTAAAPPAPVAKPEAEDRRTAVTSDAGPVSVAAIAQSAAGAGANFNGGMNDKPGGEPQRDDRDWAVEVPVDATANVEAVADTTETMGQPSPTRQVAAEVTKEIAKLEAAAPTYHDPADVKAPLSKLQVLKIQLQPDHLGSVNVRIQLRADVVELHIETSRAETAELLKRDREVLSTLMRAAGYAADDTQIKVTHADPAMTASLVAAADPASGSSSTSQNSSQQGGSQAQGNFQSSSHDRSAGSQEREEHARRPGQNQAPEQAGESGVRPGSRNPGSSGIYL